MESIMQPHGSPPAMRWITITGLTFLLFVVLSPKFSFAQIKKIYFCQVGRSANLMAPFVAKKKGFFQQEGLDVEIIQALGNICIAGMIPKNIDYTHVFGSVVRGAIKGLPVRVVMGTHDGPDHGLVVASEVKNIKELRGKAIAVSRAGGGADVVARLMMEKHGLLPDRDVKIAPLGSDEARIAALEQGLVAGASVNMIHALTLEAKGYRVLAWAQDEVEFPFNCICTTVDKIRDQADQVKKVIRAFLRAVRFIREEREQTILLTVEWTGISKSMAEKSYDLVSRSFSATGEPTAKAMSVVLEQAKKEMQLNVDIPAARVADFSLLKAVHKELGIR
jgi:NitT/TauT family transport system substrate-binding protein